MVDDEDDDGGDGGDGEGGGEGGGAQGKESGCTSQMALRAPAGGGQLREPPSPGVTLLQRCKSGAGAAAWCDRRAPGAAAAPHSPAPPLTRAQVGAPSVRAVGHAHVVCAVPLLPLVVRPARVVRVSIVPVGQHAVVAAAGRAGGKAPCPACSDGRCWQQRARTRGRQPPAACSRLPHDTAAAASHTQQTPASCRALLCRSPVRVGVP